MSEQDRKEDHNDEQINKLGSYEQPVYDGPQLDQPTRRQNPPLADLNTENAGE